MKTKPTHLTAILENGMKVIVICKDTPDSEDKITTTIERVTCYNCLKTYQYYLEMLDEGSHLLEVEEIKH